jgi:hypothetical protein
MLFSAVFHTDTVNFRPEQIEKYPRRSLEVRIPANVELCNTASRIISS